MNKEEILRNIYYNSFHPASFGGYQKLYNYAKKLNQNITLNDVKSWLSSQQEYTLFKETKNNFKRNRIYSSYANGISNGKLIFWICPNILDIIE